MWKLLHGRRADADKALNPASDGPAMPPVSSEKGVVQRIAAQVSNIGRDAA